MAQPLTVVIFGASGPHLAEADFRRCSISADGKLPHGSAIVAWPARTRVLDDDSVNELNPR